MLALYILLGLLALIILLVLSALFIPVYGRIAYDGELHVRVRVLGVPITLMPAPDKPVKKVPKKAKKDAPDKPSKVKELGGELSRTFKEDGFGATLTYLGALAKIAGQAVGRVLRSITVDKLRLELLIAGGDADDTAIRYGHVCGVLYPTLAAISGVIKVRRRDLRVEPNFLLEESGAHFEVRLHVWIYRLAWAAIVLLVRMLLLKESIVEDPITDKEVTNHGK